MRSAWANVAPIRVGAPSLGDRRQLHRRLDEILDRAWLTNHGPVEREFEERLCDLVGTRHCIPVANATFGLLLALKALVNDGEVIMPAFTFPAAAHAARFLGLEPVFCDIDPERHHLDPHDVAVQLTERTAGVLAVHLWGRACDTEAIEDVAEGLPVIYDAAHAFGAVHRGQPVGSNGHCEVFSFHATKYVAAFEGGAIATNDDDLAARLRLLSNYGFAGRDHVVSLGLNAKLSEIHAAMGIVSLDLLPKIKAANVAHLEHYRGELSGIPGIHLRTEADAGNLSYVVVEIDSESSECTRDGVMAYLRTRGVDTQRYFHPGVNRMEPYLTEQDDRALPVTASVCERVLQLPTGLGISEEGVEHVCRSLRQLLDPS
jgi:dTDP-4-amino-4,6-dideoxyglucose